MPVQTAIRLVGDYSLESQGSTIKADTDTDTATDTDTCTDTGTETD